MFALYAIVRTLIDPALDARSEGAGRGAVSARAVLVSLARILPVCAIIFLVLGLIILGIAQPTEAAAVGIGGAVLIAAALRTISLEIVFRSCYGAATATATATVLVILASAKLFSQLLAYTGATVGLVDLVSGLTLNRWVVFVIMMATVFAFCMFMDQLALMLIAVPVYTPIIAHLGFDPIWFWMLFLINITLGGITPPFGYTMFVFKSVARDVPLVEIYRAAWPFVAIALLAIALMAAFPGIVTWLPSSGGTRP
jgi:tripartite ATP-independent transporter DctM subunit